MGDASQGGGGQERERDELIKRLLLSGDEAERRQGIELLDETLRTVVASVLLKLARTGQSPACCILLHRGTRRVNQETWKEVWARTVYSVWTNVQENKFRARGSLLAYLLCIATRKAVDLCREKKTDEFNKKLDLLAGPQEANAEDLLEEIRQFYEQLPQKDSLLLGVGVKLAQANGSTRVVAKAVVDEFKRVSRDNGWKPETEEAILRRYYRLRDRLCEHLRKREYHV